VGRRTLATDASGIGGFEISSLGLETRECRLRKGVGKVTYECLALSRAFTDDVSRGMAEVIPAWFLLIKTTMLELLRESELRKKADWLWTG